MPQFSKTRCNRCQIKVQGTWWEFPPHHDAKFRVLCNACQKEINYQATHWGLSRKERNEYDSNRASAQAKNPS